MTMPYSASRALFEGNGAATQFPFSFRVWEDSQLVVSLTSPQGETTQATGWTATLSDSGGTVSYLHQGAALPAGWKLAIVRNMPFSQEIDLVSGARFDPQVMEDGLDQAAAERQQLLEQLSRAVILPPTSEQSPQEVVEGIRADRERAERAAGNAAASAQATAQNTEEAKRQAATAAREADRARAEADRATEIASVGPATPHRLGLVRIGAGVEVDEEGVIAVNIPEIPLASAQRAGLVRPDGVTLTATTDGTLSVIGVSVAMTGYPTEFRDFFEQHPPAGWAVRNGAVLENADTTFPALWAALHAAENAWKCKTPEEWAALSATAGGVGGAPFFVVDDEAGTIKLPDTRGDYTRGAGHTLLPNVGQWIPDTVKRHQHTLSPFNSNGWGEGQDGSKRWMSSQGGTIATGWAGEAESRPRTFGMLPCVYTGGKH